MSYLPRPDSNRTGEDVEDLYALAAEALRKADSAEKRREVFKQIILQSYEAGVDAQREILTAYTHERPTPVPPAPIEEEEDPDPGTLPPAKPTARPLPLGVQHPREPKKPP